MATERVKIRGLVRGPGWAFLAWGVLVLAKGIYDLFRGEPDANLYSSRPWEFISREAWLRYAAFEAVYGACCLALSGLLFGYARRLPETIERERRPAIDPF